MALRDGIQVDLDGNGISDNSADGFFGGGGVYADAGVGRFRLTGNVITGNEAREDGGGFYLNRTEIILIQGNVVVANTGENGAGAWVRPGAAAPAEVLVNIFAENDALEHGGGLFLVADWIELLGNSFARNRASGSGAAAYLATSFREPLR